MNRDINRQNKATSPVIDATIYSLITKDKLKALLDICKDVSEDNSNNLSVGSKRKLDYALSNLNDKTPNDDSNKISAKKYMASSTYVKSSTLVIATSEHKRMKSAINMHETNLLFDSSSHLTPHMVKLQETIINVPGKHPCITTTSTIQPTSPTVVDVSVSTPVHPNGNHPMMDNDDTTFNIDSNMDDFSCPIKINQTSDHYAVQLLTMKLLSSN